MGQIHVKSCGMKLGMWVQPKYSVKRIFCRALLSYEFYKAILDKLVYFSEPECCKRTEPTFCCWKLIFASADHFAQDNYCWLSSAGVCVARAAKGQMWLLDQSHQEWLPENSQSLIWIHHSSGKYRSSLTIKISVRKWFELGCNILPW